MLRGVFFADPLSSLSSSEVLTRLRVPARVGDGGFFSASEATDFGLYFGRADDVASCLGRSDDERVMRLANGGLIVSAGVAERSSEEVVEGLCTAEDLRVLRVIVFDSGVLSFFVTGGFEPSEVRGVPPDIRFMALKRRELGSFAFLALLSASLPLSLFITSASAFPTEDKFNECRIELLVEGLGGGPLRIVSEGMLFA